MHSALIQMRCDCLAHRRGMDESPLTFSSRETQVFLAFYNERVDNLTVVKDAKISRDMQLVAQAPEQWFSNVLELHKHHRSLRLKRES